MVKSLDRALSILEYISKRKSVGVTEIAREFRIDKGTASKIMQTFAEHNMVAKSDSTLKYYLSEGTLQFSYQVITDNHIIRAAHPILLKLTHMTNATSRICGISNRKIFIMDQVLGRKQRNLQDSDIPGMTKPFHCSAVGKIMLAYMPGDKAYEILESVTREAFTENTIVDIDLLMRQLEEIRTCGYALNLAEFTDRAYCIAVPVFINGSPDYCMGISGIHDYRKNRSQFEAAIASLKESSAQITKTYNQTVKLALSGILSFRQETMM